MGVKHSPKANNDKKALPECHRCPNTSFPVFFLCQILACLSHNFVKNMLAIISSSAIIFNAGAADGPHQLLDTVMQMTSPCLGCCQQAPGEGKVLTNVVETTPLSSKKTRSETGWNTKWAYCFKRSQQIYPLYLEVMLNSWQNSKQTKQNKTKIPLCSFCL